MLNDLQRTDLIRAMAGDMDHIISDLIKKYQTADNNKERERLKKIIESDIEKLSKEVGPPVANYYMDLYNNS